jgi:hypothetical protein
MNTLNLGSDEIPATKKKSNTRNLKIALGLAAVILVPTIGSTLAGTITTNTATNEVEFAQGFVDTVSCDGDISVSPQSNVSAAGTFYLDSIDIDNVSSACNGKVFSIRILNNEDPVTLELIGNAVDTCTVTFNDPTTTLAGGCTVTNESAHGFKLSPYGVNQIEAIDVIRVTIESSNS